MHKALAIPELVDLIMRQVWAEYNSRRCVLAAGLTCRTFLEPAMDYIWSEQCGIGHLVECLPEDLWMVSAHNVLDVRTPGRPVTQHDWYRFDHYARRVRTLDVVTVATKPYSLGGRHVSERLLQCLISSRPDRQLLSKLCSLDVSIAREYRSAHLFLCHSLDVVVLQARSFHDAHQVLFTALSHLPSRSPNLTTLNIRLDDHGNPSAAAMRQLFHGIIPSLHSLTYLQLERLPTPVPFDNLLQVASLPHLRGLALLDGTTDNWIMTAPTLETYTPASRHIFSALESLHLRSMCTLDGFLPALSSFRFPQIRNIIIHPEAPSDRDTLASLIQLICEGCSHETLEDIDIDTGGSSWDEEVDGAQYICSTTLRQLFCFPNICSFELTSAMFIDCLDDVFEELAASWPLLERLILHSRAPFEPITRPVTLRNLAHLARNCPQLESLGINAEVCDNDVFLPSAEQQHLRLSTLEFYRTPCSLQAVKVGIFLHALFPGITGVPDDPDDYDYTMEEDPSPSWESVRWAIDQCRQGRIDVAAVLNGHQEAPLYPRIRDEEETWSETTSTDSES
ncbi:hypothetical protein C8Q72DRAFT_653682 [Fomitopsis betulina]|nr:hypothetical protein C8Q72DRAFT_653682 [Fomitopsis betulina]